MDCNTLIGIAICIFANAPPMASDERSTLQRLRDAGIECLGRDPLAGTGLCGALLPVHAPFDVYYVVIPRNKVSADDLRLLRHFPNLQQVRSSRSLTELYHQTLRDAVPIGTWRLYNVRHSDGSITNSPWLRHDTRWVDHDINGDGIVDENDAIDDNANSG